MEINCAIAVQSVKDSDRISFWLRCASVFFFYLLDREESLEQGSEKP